MNVGFNKKETRATDKRETTTKGNLVNAKKKSTNKKKTRQKLGKIKKRNSVTMKNSRTVAKEMKHRGISKKKN